MPETTASANTENPNIIYAYEPDTRLKELVGAMSVAELFTKEKIAACQKKLDTAKESFFETAKPDMAAIDALAKGSGASAQEYQNLCRGIIIPVHNIKGQAEMYGFSLIARICQYLREYCPQGAANISDKDRVIIARLAEALQQAFYGKVADLTGAIEKELISIITPARKG
jgi:hypothetical protein